MKKVYIIEVIDRKTKEIVQVEIRKSEQSFDRIWRKAISNINPLVYKLNAEIENYTTNTTCCTSANKQRSFCEDTSGQSKTKTSKVKI